MGPITRAKSARAKALSPADIGRNPTSPTARRSVAPARTAKSVTAKTAVKEESVYAAAGWDLWREGMAVFDFGLLPRPSSRPAAAIPFSCFFHPSFFFFPRPVTDTGFLED